MAEPPGTFIDTLAGDWVVGDFEGHFIGKAALLRSPPAESRSGIRAFDVDIVRGVLRNPRQAEQPAGLETLSPTPIRQDRLFPLWIDVGHRDARGRAVDVIEIAVSDVVLVDWSHEQVDDRVTATSGTLRGAMYARVDREAAQATPGTQLASTALPAYSAAPGCRSMFLPSAGCAPPACLTAFVPMRARGCLSILFPSVSGRGCGCGCLLPLFGLFLLFALLTSTGHCTGCSDARQRVTDHLAVDNDAHVVAAASTGAAKRISIDDALDDPDPFFEQCDVPIYQSGDLLFDFGQEGLRPEALPQLRKLGRLLRLAKKRDVRIRIQGHTDSAGADDYNQDLSMRRALSVAQWLDDTRALPRGQIEVEGMGKRKPLIEGAADATLNRLNRRVEIFVPCEPASVPAPASLPPTRAAPPVSGSASSGVSL